MRKVSIALRRLGASQQPNLTSAEQRALKREVDAWTQDVDLFLKDMAKADGESQGEEKELEVTPGSETPDQDKAEIGPLVEQSAAEELTESQMGQSVATESLVAEEQNIGPQQPQPLVVDEPREEKRTVLPLGADGEPVKLALYSRQDSRADGFSATFKLSGNGNGVQSGELTVYTHKSEQQMSGLGDGQDQEYSFALPAFSSVRLGPDGKNGGWEKLSLRMPADLLWEEGEDEETAPMVPVPDEDPAALWAIPVELVSRQKDSLALKNATDQAVVVKLYLLDADGHKIAAVLDPKLNPLLPGGQVLDGVDRFFPELIGLADFRGTIIARAEDEQQIWAMGVTGEELESLIIRRALNMNVDLEGLKTKMSQELQEINEREEALKQQMAHLDAVLSLAGGNGDSLTPPGQAESTQSASASPGISAEA